VVASVLFCLLVIIESFCLYIDCRNLHVSLVFEKAIYFLLECVKYILEVGASCLLFGLYRCRLICSSRNFLEKFGEIGSSIYTRVAY